MNWNINSWRNLPILQQPDYNKNELNIVVNKLQKMDGIVNKPSIDKLLQQLAKANEEKSVILQIGDCAETFADFSKKNILDYSKMFEKNATKIENSLNKKVILIARMAGQFAKPRSENTETINGVTLPCYRGDIANGIEFSEESRKPQANRIIKAYEQSMQTMQIIQDRFFVSHEALILDYDSAMTRQFDDKFYCLSAHMLWIGYRTAQLDHAHIEFLRGIENPVGIKVGLNANPEYLNNIITKLNPSNKPGKIILIVRFGFNKIGSELSDLIKSVDKAGLKVIWISDPMHGNGYKAKNGIKTRSLENICGEIKQFNQMMKNHHVNIGGLHLEATPHEVTECVLVANEKNEEFLKESYKSLCDPRLNASQTDEVISIFCDSYK